MDSSSLLRFRCAVTICTTRVCGATRTRLNVLLELFDDWLISAPRTQKWRLFPVEVAYVASSNYSTNTPHGGTTRGASALQLSLQLLYCVFLAI